MRRTVSLSPVGWADATLSARLDYARFANVVARAVREVRREMAVDVSVYPMSAEAGDGRRWGEYVLPNGPVIVWQLPFELMEDEHNYYRQIKDVLRHEFRHALGDRHDEPGLVHAGSR